MKFLPRFVRRAVLLRRARDLVQVGEGRAALALLADPIFDGVPEARELAQAAMARAPAGETGTRASITELLARMREERARRGGAASKTELPADALAESEARQPPVAPRAERSLEPSIAFRLAIDDAGEFLAVVGSDFTIGHESSRSADLRFLAHLEREHARLVFTNDFHAGAAWRIVPIDGARTRVNGRELTVTGAVLVDGDRVLAGNNLGFRFRAGDITSTSAVLELEHGIECGGAGRILLLSAGAEGRITIGASSKRPIRVASLEQVVTLEVTLTLATQAEALLAVASAAGVARGVRPAEGAATSLSIPIPPRSSERFTFGARPRTEAPFEIVVGPVPEDFVVR